jgi:hypothetical protein
MSHSLKKERNTKSEERNQHAAKENKARNKKEYTAKATEEVKNQGHIWLPKTSTEKGRNFSCLKCKKEHLKRVQEFYLER